jgi:hypothetical protein
MSFFIMFFALYCLGVAMVIASIKVWDSFTFNKNMFNSNWNYYAKPRTFDAY